MPYDSRKDTTKHIAMVDHNLKSVIRSLKRRAQVHDQSKLEPPEKEIFDAETPKLSKLKFGSKEYQDSLKRLGPALEHHYANNSHHPEHYENGVAGMCLLDLIEMVCDWQAASKRMQGGELHLVTAFERFGIDRQLGSIIFNYCLRQGWLTEDETYNVNYWLEHPS